MKSPAKTDALSNGDLDKIAGLLDERIAPLATKELVKEEIDGLKTYVNEGFETVMGGLDNLSKQLAEKEKVERLIEWAREAGDKIGVKPKI